MIGFATFNVKVMENESLSELKSEPSLVIIDFKAQWTILMDHLSQRESTSY